MEGEHDVLERGPPLEEAGDLERPRNAKAADAIRRERRDVEAERDDAPGGRLHEPGEHVEERRLPGAVRSDKSVNASVVQRDAHAVDRAKAGEFFREVVRLEDAHRRAIVASA